MHTTGVDTLTGAYAPAYVLSPQGANHNNTPYTTGVDTPTGAHAPAYALSPLRG